MNSRIRFTHFVAAKFIVRPDKDLEVDRTGEENRIRLRNALQILLRKKSLKKPNIKIESIQGPFST